MFKQTALSTPVVTDGVGKMQCQFRFRESALSEFADAMAGFRDQCGNKATNRLLVPQTLQLMPLYMNCLQRSAIFHVHRHNSEGGCFTADFRIAEAYEMLQSSVMTICRNLYPFCVNLNRYEAGEQEGFPMGTQANSAVMPEITTSVYLLMCESESYLCVGQMVNQDWFKANIGEVEEGDFVTKLASEKLNRVFQAMRTLTGCTGSVIVTGKNAALTGQCTWMLREDSTSRDKNYYDFLGELLTVITAK